MTRFAKKETCPTSRTLEAFMTDALTPLAHHATQAHLRACDFCGAETTLLARSDARDEAMDDAVPPMPLALRLFAESRLAEANAVASASERIAA
jgi:hypothetical protein